MQLCKLVVSVAADPVVLICKLCMLSTGHTGTLETTCSTGCFITVGALAILNTSLHKGRTLAYKELVIFTLPLQKAQNLVITPQQ